MNERVNERVSELIDGYFHGTLSADEKRELAGALQSDPDARAAFAAHSQWASGMGLALTRLKEQAAGEDSWGAAHKQTRHRRWGWRPAIFAAAAAVLVTLGVSVYRGKVLSTEDSWGVVASLYPAAAPADGQSLAASVIGPDGKSETIRSGEAIRRGSTLLAGPGTCVRVRLVDGSEIDLNQETELSVRPSGGSATVSLKKGTVFCSISKRPPAAAPFGIELPGDQHVTVLGTRFEVSVGDAGAVLKVEEGLVRLQTPSATRDVGLLQMVKADASGSVSAPMSIPLSEVATWKFQSDPVPAGAILFQDDFEKGEDRWEMPGQPAGRMEVVDGRGTSGGRCLVLHLQTPDPYEAFTLYPKYQVRQRDFEFSFRYLVGRPIRGGPVFRVPGAPRGNVTTLPTAVPRIHGVFSYGDWVEYRAAVRGDDVHETWTQNGRLIQEKNGRINTAFGYFTHIGFGAHRDAVEDLDLCIDDVVIKKLESAPAAPIVPPGAILFQDDFEKGMDRWSLLMASRVGRVEIAEGQGSAGGRCLLMHLKKNDPLVLFPKFDINCSNFEVRYRSRIAGGRADPKGRWTRDGLAFRVPTARLGALTPRAETSMRYHPAGLADGWVDRRFLVRGTEVYEIGIQDGTIRFDLSSRLHVRQGDFTQIGLSAYAETGDLDFYVDDFVILKQADPVNGDASGPGAFPVQAGALLFLDDFSEGLNRWEALKVYGREKIDPGEMELVDGRGIDGKRCLVFHLKPGDSRGAVAFPNAGIYCRNFEVTCRILLSPNPIVFGLAYRFPNSPVGYDFQIDTGSSKVYGQFVDGWTEFRGEVRDGKTYQAWFQNGRLLKEKSGKLPTTYGPYTGVGLSARTEGGATDFCVSDVTIRKLGD